MRTLFLSISLLFIVNIAFAQDEDIKHIRKQYYDIVNQISESRKAGYEGTLYCNTMELNKFGKAWRAVGHFNEKVEIWYEDDPRHAEEEKPENTLKMIVVTGESSAFGYYKEFLFEDGILIFAFNKFRNEGNPQEFRYYFKDGKIIKRVSDEEGSMAEEGYETTKEASNWMTIFLKSFGL